ncbi:MAG: hypothetical protein EBR87_07070 [Cytophagia bacterium]|nr:hypothetical protein [Cytophagia bacterium]
MIEVQIQIRASVETVWDCFTNPKHIVHWNFASPDWHCPKAINDLREGGEFHYTMAAKDGSFEFDFWGTFQQIEDVKKLEIVLGDDRKMSVIFDSKGDETILTELFEPESENSIELQKAGWQAILSNFKNYVEAK